jgi:hypothetical protein
MNLPGFINRANKATAAVSKPVDASGQLRAGKIPVLGIKPLLQPFKPDFRFRGRNQFESLFSQTHTLAGRFDGHGMPVGRLGIQRRYDHIDFDAFLFEAAIDQLDPPHRKGSIQRQAEELLICRDGPDLPEIREVGALLVPSGTENGGIDACGQKDAEAQKKHEDQKAFVLDGFHQPYMRFKK